MSVAERFHCVCLCCVCIICVSCIIARGVNENLFLKLKSGDKKLEGISEATVEQLQELQDTLQGK